MTAAEYGVGCIITLLCFWFGITVLTAMDRWENRRR